MLLGMEKGGDVSHVQPGLAVLVLPGFDKSRINTSLLPTWTTLRHKFHGTDSPAGTSSGFGAVQANFYVQAKSLYVLWASYIS